MTLFEGIDQAQISTLTQLRTSVIEHLSKQHDTKKILSFLAKCGIVSIDDAQKLVYLGVPNEFVLTQIKKFFAKDLQTAIEQMFNPHFKLQYSVYQDFQGNEQHPLQISMKQLQQETKKADIKQLDPSITSKLQDYFGILFDSKYQFHNVVVGSHNNLAFNAAKAIADKPGQIYNPFFMYGSVGLGKTHLMQAIGNHIIKQFPDKVVVYLPTSKLIDEIIESIKKNKLNTLLKKFDDVDVLLLDDVQFLADKDKTQEIFLNIFNEFHLKKKQIILSSDRPPIHLNNIEARLKSRFGLGLVVDIKIPDYETRVAILQSKLYEKNEQLDTIHLHTIAKYVKDNVRELEWALNLIITRQHLSGQETNEQDILEALKTLGYQTSEYIPSNLKRNNHWPDFDQIVQAVAGFYNQNIDDLRSDSRKKELSIPRQLLMLIAKKHLWRTLEKIGEYFGGKSHATVIYSLDTLEKTMKSDINIRQDYESIIEQLGI